MPSSWFCRAVNGAIKIQLKPMRRWDILRMQDESTFVSAASSLGLGAPKTAPRSGAPLGGAAAEPKVTLGASEVTAAAIFGEEVEFDAAALLGLLLVLLLYFSRSAKYDS